MIKGKIVIAILFFSTINFAQTTNSSPYSLFGIGDQVHLKSVEEISMGQMGGALNSEYQLSLTNPASYGSLQYTTYVFSGANKSNFINDGEEKQNSSAASLTYLALGIPISGNQGVAMGLQLNTSVGYSLVDQKFNDEEELIELDRLFGDGGTNRVFLGYGYKFAIPLSLGFEAGYVFGQLENNVVNRRSGVQLATQNSTSANVRGFSYRLGAHCAPNIAENLKLKLGVTAELESELTEDGDEITFSMINIDDGNLRPVDTLLNVEYKAKIKSPLKTTLSAGIGEDNKWFAGVEYAFQDALEFSGGIYDNIETYSYGTFSNISVGGFYIPKFNSITNYFQRVTYRAGFNYQKTGLIVRGTEIDEYGISFGVGLPIGLRLSSINLGMELGKRGTTENDLVEENFFNFRLSISLNDKWFRKQKIY